MESPPSGIPEKNEIIQNYVRLSQESERLRYQLSLAMHNSCTLDSMPVASSAIHKARWTQSTSSPTVESDMPPTPTVPVAAAGPENSLLDLNQQIKATLTSLLNCETVKHDQEFRGWVQERLMEAEHELKRARRRRSSLEREEVMKELMDSTGRLNALEWKSFV